MTSFVFAACYERRAVCAPLAVAMAVEPASVADQSSTAASAPISLNPNTTALAALSSSRSISSSPKPLLTRPTESRDHDREGDEEPELTDANAMSLRGDVHASKFRLQLAGA